MKRPKFSLAKIGYEYGRAVAKHGAKFPDYDMGFEALISEVEELREALGRGDVYGTHGIQNEAAQVAAVCIKIIEGARKHG